MRVLKSFIFTVGLLMLTFSPSFAMGQFAMVENSSQGKQAPDFTLKGIDGKDLTLSQVRDGKKAIIFFWATWCPHCREQLKHLSEQAADIEQKGVKIILVDIGEEAAPVQEYVMKYKIPFPVFLDQQNKISDEYGIIGVPTFFFVNKDGMVKAIEHALPDNYDEVLSK